MHDLAGRLLGFQVIDMAEARAVAAIIADRTTKVSDHGLVYFLLAPVMERFAPKSADERTAVCDTWTASPARIRSSRRSLSSTTSIGLGPDS